MKKVALSLMALALVGVGAFAEGTAGTDVKNPVTASVAANASASWGYDLDTKGNGFTNSVESKVTLWLLNGTNDKTGEGDVHGYISIADIKVGLDDKASGNDVTLSIGDVTAKIVAGDLYIKLYTNTDPEEKYAYDADNSDHGNIADDTYKTSAGLYGAQTEWNFANITGYSTASSKGIEVGYALPKLVTLTAAVGSDSDWTDVDGGDYEGSIEASLTAVDKLTAKGKFYTGSDAGTQSNAVGAAVAYDLGVAAPFADLNFNLTKSTYTADFGAKAPLVDGVLLTAVGTYADTKVVNGLLALGLAEGKIAGPLSANVGVRILDATKAVATYATTEIFAKVGLKATDVIKVYGTIDTYNTNANDSSLFLKAGVDFTGISLTTLSVNWDSNDFGSAKTTKAANGVDAATLGKVVFTAKVAY